MNLNNYCQWKTLGVVRLIKVSGRVFVEKKKWDPDTGVEVESPELLPVDTKSLITKRDQMESDLEILDCFLEDVASLEDVV